MSDIKLVSHEGEVFEVSQKFAKLSSYVSSAIKHAAEGVPVHLNNISSIAIRKIIEYVSHYNYDPPQIDEDDDKPVTLTQWDITFLQNTDNKTVFDIVNATNTLDLQSLNTISIKYVAMLIKGKTTGQVKELFGLENEEDVPTKKRKV